MAGSARGTARMVFFFVVGRLAINRVVGGPSGRCARRIERDRDGCHDGSIGQYRDVLCFRRARGKLTLRGEVVEWGRRQVRYGAKK